MPAHVARWAWQQSSTIARLFRDAIAASAGMSAGWPYKCTGTMARVRLPTAAAHASGVGVDRELRPLLRPIAAMRLARRGVDLDRHGEKARELLGDPLWEVVRADRPRASNLVAGGISAVELEDVIERLERL